MDFHFKSHQLLKYRSKDVETCSKQYLSPIQFNFVEENIYAELFDTITPLKAEIHKEVDEFEILIFAKFKVHY